jgi:hypothetical protein
MTYPTAAVNTTNVDAGTDSPATARSDILDALAKLNQMIAHTTTFAATLLDDANAATARGTLGALGASDTIANATTSASCSGNAATATNAAACSGNAATATTAANAIGVGQTWQDLTGSRSAGTIYTNSTGRSISVSITSYASSGTNGYSSLTVAGLTISKVQGSNTVSGNLDIYTSAGIVPSGATYQFSTAGSTFLDKWFELR